ncbi:ribulokinase [Rhodoferax sp.]|uniref:ribulokinase n=1 Tax=Rhodoferax sp. TaxID=50421 RepID=UPI002625526E|nr:ribulokinase [Rhodoferax sp.]MDD2925304.1 ribulokinase [Rhodoferax sp.]
MAHPAVAYTLGFDFGTNSARAVVVDSANGQEIGSAVVAYPSGHDGILLDPAQHHLARQRPADHLLALEKAGVLALEDAQSSTPAFRPALVRGIGVAATGSSPLPVDRHNQPLACDTRFAGNLNAQCWLWKDHTSIDEAQAITHTAQAQRPHYLARIGGTYSAEWFWAKIWHCLQVDADVFDAAFSWVELADFLPATLCGITDPRLIRRGICMAGHKALYAPDWGGLPDGEFLAALHPRLAALRDHLYAQAHDISVAAGHLCPDWAQRLGLPVGLPIAVGELDVHFGAIGCGVDEGTLVKVIGTSTCDCAVVASDQSVADIPGICGVVRGAILPGYDGIEAGQSAVGDIFKWWVEGVLGGDAARHERLTAEAAALRPGQSGLLALDWNNGNRTVLVDQRLTGLLLGQTLHTTPADIYRALIEATAFGARVIIERLRQYGVPISRVVCSGGIADKNALLMQIYADVTGCEMRLARSSQACALGAAIAATVLAGLHPDLRTAQMAMTGLRDTAYHPDPRNRDRYDLLYTLYLRLHDAFGGVTSTADLSLVMKTLLELKSDAQGA